MNLEALRLLVTSGAFEQFSSQSAADRIAVLHALLQEHQPHIRIQALRAVSPDTALALLEEISELCFDWRPSIRAQALQALRGLDPYQISGILQEALRDPNRKVRQIAAELFHSLKRAA